MRKIKRRMKRRLKRRMLKKGISKLAYGLVVDKIVARSPLSFWDSLGRSARFISSRSCG